LEQEIEDINFGISSGLETSSIMESQLKDQVQQLEIELKELKVEKKNLVKI